MMLKKKSIFIIVLTFFGIVFLGNRYTIHSQETNDWVDDSQIDALILDADTKLDVLESNQPIASSESKEQLEKWFYAVYGLDVYHSDWELEYFNSSFGAYQKEAQIRLETEWMITDRKSAIKTIGELLNGKFRIPFQKLMSEYKDKGYMELSLEELAEKTKDKREIYDLIVAYKENGDGTIDAFDYCTAMRLVRESYYAGYITEREQLDQMLEIGKILQGAFDSWDELMESFCRGAEYDKKTPYAYEGWLTLYQCIRDQTEVYQIDWDLKLEKEW